MGHWFGHFATVPLHKSRFFRIFSVQTFMLPRLISGSYYLLCHDWISVRGSCDVLEENVCGIFELGGCESC